MDFKLFKATSDLKEVFSNLMQFYYYDFSEYLKLDTKEKGLFEPYPNLYDYFENGTDKFPYLIKADENYVGFALVRKDRVEEQDYFSMVEFFILRKYRRNGIGEAVAIEIFNSHRGKWEVYQRKANKPSLLFWNKTIHKYTNGQFSERAEQDKIIQNFQS